MGACCSDKTGTLTAGEIVLDQQVDLLGQPKERVLELIYLNSYFEAGIKSPLDDAILRHEHPSIESYQKVDEIPFDFVRKRLSVVAQLREGDRLIVTKGAVESVLDVCTRVEAGGSVAPFDGPQREAANIILLEKDLQVLHDGIVEGRRSFSNIMKYIIMDTSSNFGNMFSMAAASLFLPFLPMLPTQILLNNLLNDTSQLSIPGDTVDAGLLRRPKRWNIGFIRQFMLIIGPISSVYDFMTFGILLWLFHADEKLFHTGWFVESLASQR
jgi:magnesium-transporting ATPase (P-type)